MIYLDKKFEPRMKTDAQRRKFLKLAGPLGVLLASPAFAFDIFKDMQKTQQILKGTGSILASSTDLDYKSEFAIGESLALEGFRRYGLPVKDPGIQKYVNLVGNAVAASSDRSDIPYYFTVVESPLYNAFACPGGIIFVTSTLTKSMEDESELAGVLAHEVAHVSHKHALQSIKRAKFFEGVGQITAATMKGEDGKKFQDMIGDLQGVLFDKGLDKNMEFEADATALQISYRTGYNPSGLVRVLEMLERRENVSEKKGSWFSTHPPLNTRISKCRPNVARYPDAQTLASGKERFTYYKLRL